MDMDDIINTQNNITTSSTSLSSSPTPQNHITHQQQQFWLMMNNNNNPSSHRHHSFNLNDNDDPENDKEAMFEKPLTPSDVGKLNRLVIPKQHAERYFPLGGDENKGLLLSFEDDSGKAWRFRYSYWNSSQSYVLTKGWSRYVKDNRLLAGDVVLFRRLRSRSDRLFIACRRRPSAADDSPPATTTTVPYPAHPHYNNDNNSRHLVAASVVPYQPDSIHAGLLSPAHHQSQTTTVGNNSSSSNNNNNNNNNNSSKILRLFGVNLECHDHQDQSEPSTPDGSSLSSQDLLLQPHHHHHQQQQFYPPQAYYSNHLHNHMDFTFSQDVKPMRNRRG